MARRWEPPSSVGNKEVVGRRLFDPIPLAGADDQKAPEGQLLYGHFEDTRGQTSLDRLGRTNTESKVLRYLSLQANDASKKFKPEKKFSGWATTKAETIKNPPKASEKRKLDIISSPKDKDEESEGNPYHAHIETQEDIDDYFLALHLMHIFQSYGSICPDPAPDQEQKNTTLKNPYLEMLRRWIRGLKHRILGRE